MKRTAGRYALLGVAFCLWTSSAAWGAPDITQHPTVISDGQNVTIGGNGFGTKPLAAPIKWDKFDNGTPNAPLNTIRPEWKPYSNTSTFFLAGDSHSGNLSVGTTSQTAVGSNYIMIPPSEEVFISYWYKADNVDPDDYGIVKMARINSSPAAGGGGVYNGTGSYGLGGKSIGNMHNQVLNYDNGADGGQVAGYAMMGWNKWNRIDMYVKLGSPGAANGIHQCQSVGYNMANQSGVVNRAAGTNFKKDAVYLGAYISHGTGVYQVYLDDIYIDNTRARVELGNSSVFSSCTHREMQIPTNWAGSGNQISFNVNQGTFSDSEQVWLFVVDSAGRASGGVPVSFSPPSGPPQAAFSGTPQSGTAPLEVSFSDRSAPGGSPITQWVWNFGDGTTGSTSNPTHVFNDAGQYTVSLTVTSAEGTDSISIPAFITAEAGFVGPGQPGQPEIMP